MKTVTLVYTGSHGTVRVPLPSGGEAHAQWGKPFETSETHARALLAQPANWQTYRKQKPADVAAEKEST